MVYYVHENRAAHNQDHRWLDNRSGSPERRQLVEYHHRTHLRQVKTPTTTSAAKVQSWAWKAQRATAERDAAIRAMRDEGASLRTIAEAAGLTHTAIAKILARS